MKETTHDASLHIVTRFFDKYNYVVQFNHTGQLILLQVRLLAAEIIVSGWL